MFTGSEQLSKQESIKYTHITLNVGAAIKEFHVEWNQLEYWSKVIKIQETFMLLWIFGAIGSYISGNALEGTLHQLGMCQPDVMSTLLSGKHCILSQTLL